MALTEALRVDPRGFRLDPKATAETPDATSKEDAVAAAVDIADKIRKLQLALYAENRQSLLIVLQGMDAAGKDGTIRHVVGMMNPQGCSVTGFKQPTALELRHDFLWRVHPHVPAMGEIAVFNRSHYEDILIGRVHGLCPMPQLEARYEEINQFESLLTSQAQTRVIKFFLHISREEQLARFAKRLNDPAKNWKISESDYTERAYWDAYQKAYQDALQKTSTPQAPWFVIPADNKWYRNFAVSRIVLETLEDMKPRLPKPAVDLAAIRKQFHEAEAQSAAKTRTNRTERT